MKTFINLTLCLFTVVLFAQKNNASDQNPNHEASYQKYLKDSNNYISKQGTTVQDTYVAIDPMEEKRIRRKTHKEHRAMRSLWRHQERLERAKNTRYYRAPVNFGLSSSIGFRNWGLGFSNFRGFRNPNVGCSYYIR